MDTFTRGQLRQLLEQKLSPCVSLYLPTHRGGSEQDPIRWKNLLRQAEERLLAQNLRAPAVRELLEPARNLLGNDPFWQQQGDGLAVFVAPAFLRTFRLPETVPELVVTANRFHLKPLLPLLDRGRYYVLSVSQKQVRLLEGTAIGLEEVPVEGLPKNLAETLRFHDTDEPLTFHTRPAPGGRGRWAAIFHGHGVGIDDYKEDLLRYFQQIDRGLHELLREEQVPLVLASVEYLWPIYRAANRYPHLLETGVPGNPDQLSRSELWERSRALVEPRFAAERLREMARYQQLAGTGLATGELDEVVRSAWSGRLEVLFVAREREVWGTVDPVADRVVVHTEHEPEDLDLLDFAAVQTLRHGGTVHVVNSKEVPGGKVAAGLYRVGGGQR